MIITSTKTEFNQNAIYRFCKKVFVNERKKSIMNLFAEARYKLYINGNLVAFGPCKGSNTEKYYDEVDVTDYITEGENTIEVLVLQLVSLSHVYEYSHLTSVMRDGGMVLAAWGNLGDCEIETDEEWLCAKEHDWNLIRPVHSFYVGMNENIGTDFGKNLVYEKAKVIRKLQCIDIDGGRFADISPWIVRKRIIPMLYLKPEKFCNVKDNVYDAGQLTCGYVRIKLSGTGTAKLTYAESKAFEKDGKILKYHRDDENGVVIGDYDQIAVDGSACFESWWFRTFRYIKAELDGVVIDEIDYIDTGYPLEVYNGYDFGDETDNKLFDISINTLRRCMHESYEDCPYYEQLQYTMDTHLQMLFTYQLTNDDRLARKAINDFASSYVCGSVTQSRFPSLKPQIIPGFSLFFIFMLYEHAKRFSDFEFIEQYLHIADGIIGWFEKHLDNNMVKRTKFWDFVDWADEFDYGQQPTTTTSTVYSLMLVKATEQLDWLHKKAGRSTQYSHLAEQIKKSVRENCYHDEKGLFADSYEKNHFSQHSQIWAVLCDVVTGNEAKELMTKSQQLTSKATYAYMFYLFRAMEKAGMYEKVDEILDSLRELIALGCTTLPEVPGENSRSECHAWSSIAIYEFTAKVLGVTVQDETIYIQPIVGKRKSAKGKIAAFGECVCVGWNVVENQFKLEVSLPAGHSTRITMPDGSVIPDAVSGEYVCKL